MKGELTIRQGVNRSKSSYFTRIGVPWAAALLTLLLTSASSRCSCRGPFLFRQDIREHIVRIPEMKSATCADAARKAALQLDGVIGVTPDISSQTLTVRYDSRRTAKKNIERALAEAGFNVGSFPVNEQARQRLPAECRE